MKYKDKAKSFWTNRSKSKKIIFTGTIAIVAILITAIILFSTSSKFVPLYNNLSSQEVGSWGITDNEFPGLF